MFADADIRAVYEGDLHMHDQPLVRCLLADAVTDGIRTFVRVTQDTIEIEPLLPWSEEDRWLIEEATR